MIDTNEGWARPNKFPELDDIINSIKNETPKRNITTGPYWKQNVTKLKNDKNSLRAALYSIYRLAYMGKPLPPNHSSGFGQPEMGYRFKGKSNFYHTHLAKYCKYALCWNYENNNLKFDLVPHKKYDEYMNKKSSGTKFTLPN